MVIPGHRSGGLVQLCLELVDCLADGFDHHGLVLRGEFHDRSRASTGKQTRRLAMIAEARRTMCRSVFSRGFLILFLAFALHPRIVSASTLLGTVGEEIASPVDVFIDPNTVKDLGDGQFMAKTLNVYPHTIAGIDFFDHAGGHVYDTRYPHRSYVLTAIYDCPRRMTAKVRTVYYSGRRPASGAAVYNLAESDVVFIGQYPGIPSESLVLDVICAPQKLPESDLLSGYYSTQKRGLMAQSEPHRNPRKSDSHVAIGAGQVGIVTIIAA